MAERYAVLMEEVGARGVAIGPFFLPDSDHGVLTMRPSTAGATGEFFAT